MPQSRTANDIAVFIHTSGTSGLPKGVPLTYENLQSDVDAAIAHVIFQHRHNFLGMISLARHDRDEPRNRAQHAGVLQTCERR